MQAEFICLEDKAFKAVIDKVVAYVKEIHGIKEDKWISPEKAMEKLNCGKTTLQRYRDENLIVYSELSPRAFLYDVDSIKAYIEKKKRDKF